MVQLYANNAATTLAAPCSAVATEITVADGSTFPSPTAGDWFLLTIYQLAGTQEVNHEIMKVTARAGNVVTVVRSFEDAARFPARSYTVGDFAELRMTAASKGLASQITCVPAGAIAATDVQAALAELDAEKQPIDATLTAFASVTVAAGKLVYGIGADAFATTDLTAAGRALLDDADAAAQRATLGLDQVDNTSDANKPVSTAQAAADAAALTSAKAYADGLVVGLWDDRGNYDASAGIFPGAGGSGAAGSILKGDIWTVSVPGTLGGVAVAARQTLRALIDTPAQTAGNWAIGLGNTDLDDSISNGITGRAPSQNAVFAALALKVNANNPAFTGTATGLTSAMVGLGSVNNTSDAEKPVSFLQQAALDQKVNAAFVAAAVAQGKADLVGSSSAALNTLDEFAAALGNDSNFAATTATALGNRLRTDVATQGLTDTQKSNAMTNLGMANVENKSSATIRGEITHSDVTAALGFTPADSATDIAELAIAAAATAVTKAGEATAAAAAAVPAAVTAVAKAGEAADAAAAAVPAAATAVAAAEGASEAWDAFCRRNLGSNSVDPTTDNQGAPLQVGAQYWNSVNKEMRVWEGTAWTVTYNTMAGYTPIEVTTTLSKKLHLLYLNSILNLGIY